MKVKIRFLLIALLAIGVMSIGIIGCGGDDEDETPAPTTTPTTTTPTDDGEGEIATGGTDIDFAAEKAEVLALWAEYMKLYNEREMTEVRKLWTGKASGPGADFLFVNISENERIDAQGAKGVQDTLLFLTNGHHSTKNDKWNGANMNEVFIRKKGGVLQASAHGPNALRQGESWAYFDKSKNKWLINKVESIETRNLAIHVKIEIHEDQVGNGFGYFDDDKDKID